MVIDRAGDLQFAQNLVLRARPHARRPAPAKPSKTDQSMNTRNNREPTDQRARTVVNDESRPPVGSPCGPPYAACLTNRGVGDDLRGTVSATAAATAKLAANRKDHSSHHGRTVSVLPDPRSRTAEVGQEGHSRGHSDGNPDGDVLYCRADAVNTSTGCHAGGCDHTSGGAPGTGNDISRRAGAKDDPAGSTRGHATSTYRTGTGRCPAPAAGPAAPAAGPATSAGPRATRQRVLRELLRGSCRRRRTPTSRRSGIPERSGPG